MKQLKIFLIYVLVVTMITTATALPEILDGFDIRYDTFKTRLDTCDLCHIPGKQKGSTCEVCKIPNKPEKNIDLNLYGIAIKYNLNKEMSQTFNDIENLDSDGDKYTNIDEIRNLTFPGDKKDSPNKQKVQNLTVDQNFWKILSDYKFNFE